MKNRAVITHIALVTPLGHNLQTTWDHLINEKSGLTLIKDPCLNQLKINRAGLIQLHQTAGQSRWLFLFDRLYSQLQADFDSSLNQVYFSIGSAFLGIEKGSFLPVQYYLNQLSRQYHINPGQVIINTNTCAAGNFALHTAANLIKSGRAQTVVCGAIDIITPYLWAGFSGLKNLSPNGPCPFSKARDGLTLSEGGALMILQNQAQAQKNRQPVYCEYAGFGASCDTAGITGMDKSGEGIVSCIKQALLDANISAEQVDCISAHGTSTRLNDQVEARAVSRVFPHHPPIQALKSYWGHAMGASSAIEAALLSYSIKTGTLISLLNKTDFEFDLNFLIRHKTAAVNYAVNHAFGFGGINSCLILKRYYESKEK